MIIAAPSESEAEVRRVCLRKEQSDFPPEFGVGLEDGSEVSHQLIELCLDLFP